MTSDRAKEIIKFAVSEDSELTLPELLYSHMTEQERNKVNGLVKAHGVSVMRVLCSFID